MEYIKRKVNKCWMRRVRLYIIVRTCIVYTRTTLATEKVSMIIYQRLGGLGTNVNDFELVALVFCRSLRHDFLIHPTSVTRVIAQVISRHYNNVGK